jgi:FkbM family methyltransferase
LISSLNSSITIGRILVYARGGTDDLYNCLPGREDDVFLFILNTLRPGDVFVDIGANIGSYTIIASKLVGTNGKVFAVEPIPSTVKVLNYNIKLNGLRNVIVINKAAYNSNCRLKMKIPFNSFGLASFFSKEGIEVEVDSIRLDEVLADVHKIKLIKIDAEGAEYEIIQGLTETLIRTEYVVIELSRRTYECLQLLKKYGFICEKMRFTTYYKCYKQHT